jgi:hypothetical protein
MKIRIGLKGEKDKEFIFKGFKSCVIEEKNIYLGYPGIRCGVVFDAKGFQYWSGGGFIPYEEINFIVFNTGLSPLTSQDNNINFESIKLEISEEF